MDELDYDAVDAADYLDMIKDSIAEALSRAGVNADPLRGDTDIYVDGWLTDILEVALEWRSEIEEELS